MDCHYLKYVVITLVWHQVLAQYTHFTGHQTEYFAVLNQHEPGKDCINKQFQLYKALGTTFFVAGTKAPKDLGTFATNAKTTLNQQTLVPFETWGKVSNQALEAFNRLMNAGLKDYFYELWAESCDLILQFRSHSLACCVDQMIGVYLTKKKIFPSSQLAFMGGGCPRCGDQDFAYNVDNAFAASIRFNFKEDPIPTYPDNTCAKNTNAQSGTGTDCWFHGCQSVAKYSFYLLAGASVTYKKCTTAEDTACHSGTDPSWHTKYFQVKTADWTSVTCPLGPKYSEIETGQ